MTLLDILSPFLVSMPGATEWIIILVIVILLFGAKKIPDLAKGLGKGMKEFKDAKEGKDEEIEDKK
jgi:sec-independent protein translocase protein TatA